jgi:uncharacterized protein (DUF2336 family)
MEKKLSEEDVLALMGDGGEEGKLLVAQKICSQYLKANYNADELKIVEEIFRIAIRDAEVKIRVTISEALKEAEHLPHDIALSLANDVNDVADPMIEYSPVLTDEDLMEIIKSSDMQKIIAISRRKNLTKKLAKKLLKNSNKDVITNILGNSQFANSEKGFEDIITSLADNRDAIKALIGTISLPPKLTETMMHKVADNMVQEMKKKYDFSPGVLDRVAGHTLELSTLTIITEKSTAHEVESLISHLYDFNRLTTSLIISSLCVCKIRFFISALSKRSGVSKANIKTLMESGGIDGLSKLLTKAGMPEKLHASIKVVVDFIIKMRDENPKMTTRECSLALIENLEKDYSSGKVEYLNYLLAIAKQNLKSPVFGVN